MRMMLWILGINCALVFPASAVAQKEKNRVDEIAYKGWKKCLRLSNDACELIVTLDVGPRIINFRLKDGTNVFKEYDDQLGKSGEKDWQIRGGHRLWTAPENERTYFPDNAPVKAQTQKGAGGILVTLLPPPEGDFAIQKQIAIHFPEQGTKITLTHTITNLGKDPTELAIWALTVMAPGGLEIVPLPEKKPHPGSLKNAKSVQDFWPNHNLVLWPYFDFKDPRVHLGSKFITLKQNPKSKGPIKFGLLHLLGWVAYLNQGALFVKHIPYEEGKNYPDRGCNFETFTNEDMLEIESLSPMTRLAPKASITFTETWQLFGNVPQAQTEEEIEARIVPVVKRK